MVGTAVTAIPKCLDRVALFGRIIGKREKMSLSAVGRENGDGSPKKHVLVEGMVDYARAKR